MKKKTIVLPQDEFKHTMLIDGNKFNVVTNDKIISMTGTLMSEQNTWYMPTEAVSVKSKNCTLFNPDKLIDVIRPHDIEMMYNISNFGINTPKWLYCNDIYNYIRTINPNNRYMLKAFNQARSMGKVIVDYEFFTKIIEDIFNYELDKTEDIDNFNNKYNIDVGAVYEDYEKAITLRAIKDSSFYIQELVNIRSEFRVVYIKGMLYKDLLIEERFGYSPNDKVDRTHNVVNNSNLDSEILTKLLEFANHLDKFTLSFDVYIDNEGNWGLLEYSTQYGLDYPVDKLLYLKKFYNKALVEITK